MTLEVGALGVGEEAAAGFQGFEGVLGLEEGMVLAEAGALGFYEIVVTIARLLPGVGQAPSPVRGGVAWLPSLLGPTIEILDHLWYTGRNHADLIPTLANLLKNTWHCRTVVIDATGLGAPMASLLTRLLGSRTVHPFTFTAQSKSRLGFNLLAAVNANRLKLYAPDGSPEVHEFHRQLDHAQVRYRPNKTMDFFVDPRDGHDDFISSLALLVEAAGHYQPRIARGNSVLTS